MKNKILLTIATILSFIFVLEPKNSINNNFKIESKNTIDVKDSETGNIENKELEEYIVGVVAAEMPATFYEEALKAQAIAARTYAYYKMKNSTGNYDVISDISNQAYITKEQMKEKWQDKYALYYNKVLDAVTKTSGEIMTYKGNVIEAFYFAMSNGYTEDVASVFNEDLPYLKSVKSKWDNNSLNKYEVTISLSKSEFCEKLGISCDNLNIENQIYDNTGRTKTITINSKTFKGTDFRKLLDLRSADFKIDVQNDLINITTKGYGHGVGMSQYGANGMAKDGSNCYEILKHYYQGIKIEKI